MTENAAAQVDASQAQLKEQIAKQAFKSLNWAPLKDHLDSLKLDDDLVEKLLGHLRRSSDFLLKRPDDKREALRLTFVQSLAAYLEEKVGSLAAEKLQGLITTIQHIEAGYAEIFRCQGNSVAAKMLPETQSSAALLRAARGYQTLEKDFIASSQNRTELTLQSLRVPLEDGTSYAPDEILAGIVKGASMTLQLLGYQNKWFDSDRHLVLPKLTAVTGDEIYKAGLTEALAAAWRGWERLEQRCRYFNGDLKVYDAANLPKWAPEGAQKAIEYEHVSALELWDYVAHERLNDRLIQTFLEMSLQTDLHDKGVGISGVVALPPHGHVSAHEAHSGVSLSEILGYSIVDATERPCGLRLLEWIRGYSALRCLAEEHHAKGGVQNLCPLVARSELISLLERVGLKDGAAERFIDLASFYASSRDLFDQPLIRMQDGSLLLFGPALLNIDPTRVTLSAIGNREESIERKGQAFESSMLDTFRTEGLNAQAFKFKRDDEEFEFDLVVPWEDHLFLFECKNRTLSGHHYVPAYYFAQEQISAIEQVLRLAAAIEKYPDAVLERSGIDPKGLKVVPCVLNSLPYAMKGARGGVYVTDASGLKRFFQERYFHTSKQHKVGPNQTILHRIALKSIWAGEKPTPEDLIEFLEDPIAVQLQTAHIGDKPFFFGLGARTVVATRILTRAEMTTESISKVCSVDPKNIRRIDRAASRAIAKVRKRREEGAHHAARRSVTFADREWRKQQRRRPPEP